MLRGRVFHAVVHLHLRLEALVGRPERTGRHAERVEHALLEKGLPALAGHHLDDGRADVDAGVGVLHLRAGLEEQRTRRRDRRGLPQRRAAGPAAALEVALLRARISNGKPPVWFKAMRTVSAFFALTSVFTPFVLDARTQSSLNSGRYFETAGSSSVILPSSTRIAIVTPQKPLVCEHCMKTSSIVIGRFAATSA